jgi:mono/diheme cytochrome c family protein
MLPSLDMSTRGWILPAILCGLGACSPASAPPAPQAGADLFNGNCVACHQRDGRGIPGVYPSLAGSPMVLGDPKALLLWIVDGQRPATMPAGRYATAMPQFGWLKDSDAAALMSYLRSNFGNAAPPVDSATVAEALGD